MNRCGLFLPVEREILENTIQHLYGLGLKLEACLGEATPASREDKLNSVIDNIGELIDSLRSRIEVLESQVGESK